MPTTTDDIPAARWDLPMEQVQRGQAATLRLRLYRSGAPHVPSAASVAIERSDGSELLASQAAAIAGGECTYALAGSVTAGEPLGSGYMLRWTADGRSYDLPLALCRTLIYPTVSDLDVRRRWPYLQQGAPGSLTATSSWQGLIDDAWLTLQRRLIDSGRRPWLVLSPGSLYEPHLLLAGSRIHESLAARGSPVMQDRAERLHAQYEAAWARTAMHYDDDEDGRLDDERRRLAAQSSVWLGGSPGLSHRGRW